MEHYNNPHLLMELKSTKPDKLWFDSVKVPLSSAMNVSSMHTMDSWYSMLCRRAALLTKWCMPMENNAPQPGHTNHANLWTPCGHVTIILGIRQYNYTTYIYTYKLLVVQFDFLLFEVDASNEKCVDSSSLSICQYNESGWICPQKWHYCGRHQPWLETTSSNKVTTTLVQLNVRSSCNISFTYTSIDINIAVIYDKYEQRDLISWIKVPFGFKVDQHDIKAYNHLAIVARFGFRFQLDSIRTCCFSGHIRIYEGERNYHPLLYRKVNTQYVEEPLNIIANYFQLSVQQYADTINFNNSRDIYFMLRYTFVSVDLESLQIGEVATLNNAEGLLYKGYQIKYNGVKFPNVSLTIRKFEGWNENYCHFGGYVLMHLVMKGTAHEASYEQGPFCSKSLPSHPFVGNIGPKYIVLGSFEYYLIVYAFGPLYTIDIDIHIHPSDCEGLFEPHNMCYPKMETANHKVDKPQRYIRGSHYETLCVESSQHGKPIYLVKTYNIKKCVVVQSISLRREYNEYYSFVGTMDIGLTVIKMPPYLSEGKNTALVDGYARLVALNLHTHIIDINILNKPWRASYLKISTLNLYLCDVCPSHGMYIYLHVDVINTTTDCTNSVNDRNVFWAMNNNTLALFEISNLCGLLRYSIPFVYAFNFNLHAVFWHSKSIFMYMHLHTWCTTNRTWNIFTVVAQRGAMFHSVSIIKELYVLNQQFEPIGVVYQNYPGCTFQIVYRARMYLISSYFGLDYGSLQLYIKVR